MNITMEDFEKETGIYTPNNVIVLGYDGSVAHGMFNDRSADVDIRGVFMNDPFALRGAYDHFEGGFVDLTGLPFEVEFFGFKKFVMKLESGDPQFLPWMWSDHEKLFESDWGKALFEDRSIFLGSETILNEFSRQAKRKLRLMDPETGSHTIKSVMRKEQAMGIVREKRYEEFGFDTKNAVHAIRILRMGIEVFETGQFKFFREDAKELLDIKFGKRSLKEVQDEAEKLLRRFEYLAEWKGVDTMPKIPDPVAIEKWAREFEEGFWSEQTKT